jgi:hypothetical protein
VHEAAFVAVLGELEAERRLVEAAGGVDVVDSEGDLGDAAGRVGRYLRTPFSM